MLRHLKILEFALLSLLRKRWKNGALLVVYAFMVFVLASVLFLTHALQWEASRLLVAAPDIVVQTTGGGRHDLIPAEAAAPIAGIPGVASAEPRWWGDYYDSLTGANYTLLGAGAPSVPLALLEGRFPSTEWECAVGRGVARARRLGVGDELILVDAASLGVVMTVAGVFDAESSLLTEDLVVLRQEDLRAFFAFPGGMATDIAVVVPNPEEVPTVAGKIKRLLPRSRPITKNEILHTYDAVFSWRGGMMLALFASALAAFCILAWDKATGLSAGERREIAVLKALGWDAADVLALKGWEGAVLSLTAFLAGTVAAYTHVFYFDAPLLAQVLKGWSVLFPPLRLVPHVDLYQVAVIGCCTVVPYIAATLAPSWRAAVTDPDAVFRSDEG